MIVAANFKTNHTRESTANYLEALNLFLDAYPTLCDVRIYPAASSFLRADLYSHIKLGAQNFYPVINGAYTGEIGAQQLSEFGIKNVLIGHSERRIALKETQEFIAKKYAFAKENGWKIIYCIGESKDVRDGGFEATMEYLWSEFDGIDINYEKLCVAYEPIWAIGTGVSAESKDIAEVLDMLKNRLSDIPLLYGGSVNAENLASIISLKSCEGALIGNASLDVANFSKLIQIAQNVQKQ
ncbi:MAG: triose-phosphate isomerase [Campylobacteraceae bacterium]|jgi:triosephosphate isomerase|nr:triose-phosphate isomerase [Campylobacteraceae bacterium]